MSATVKPSSFPEGSGLRYYAEYAERQRDMAKEENEEKETKTENPEPKFSASIKVQREYKMDLFMELKDMDQLTRVEDKLKKLGFHACDKEETPAEKFQREMEEAHADDDKDPIMEATASQPTSAPAPAPQGTGGQQLSNIQAGSNIPVCPMHSQPMDRITKTGIPYHSFKGKNCSGEGWWGQPNQQNG